MKEKEVEIDLLQIVKAIWKRAWVIILVMAICGGAAFGVTKFLITPQYSSRILMYVNNRKGTEDKPSISQGDIVAAQSLVDTYKVILRSQSTLDEIIIQGELPYTAGQLDSMITSAAVNSTEVFYVEVTSPDPAEAAEIANLIGEVLPRRISAVVDGSSVRLVDYAKAATAPSSPNTVKNVMLAALLGAVISCIVIVVKQLTNDKINSPDYLVQNYNIPVLSVIPDLTASQDGSGYYQSSYANSGRKQ